MKPMSMLVTADGQWVFEGSAEFFTALGDSNPDYDAPAYAIRNLGFIKFQILGGSVVEVELHPRNVQLPALLAVQQQLLSSRVRLFRIKYLDMEWKSEILSSADLTITRLSELCTPDFIEPYSERFTSSKQDYGILLRDGDNPLSPIMQKWRTSFGYFDPTLISFAIRHKLLSRMMIVGIKSRNSDPRFRFIGDGFRWLEDDYQYIGIGERIENQPDKEYGAWVAEFYKSVASTGQPRYDFVKAAIQLAPPKKGLFVTRYERLLLPWRTSSAEVFVTLSSQKRLDEPSVDLGPPKSSEPFIRVSAKSAKASAADKLTSTTSRSPQGDAGKAML